MKTTIKYRPALPLVNDENFNQFVNRLTIYSDGEVAIEEIHQSNKSSISQMEFNGEAISCSLPGVIYSVDVDSIIDFIEQDGETWEEFKVRFEGINIYEHVEFFDDYTHGWFEDCETDEEMENHIKKHGHNIDKIAEEIKSGGCSYVALEYWVERKLCEYTRTLLFPDKNKPDAG